MPRLDGPWPFADPPNVAVFTTRAILERRDWVHRVTHDADDGAWHFLPVGGAPEEVSEAALIALEEMIALDATLVDLAALPLGWGA